MDQISLVDAVGDKTFEKAVQGLFDSDSKFYPKLINKKDTKDKMSKVERPHALKMTGFTSSGQDLENL